ncbi:MAG: putative bifunctional diguanylate cyclase/phosphodiesterase [Gammaproteobacteria bacterium]
MAQDNMATNTRSSTQEWLVLAAFTVAIWLTIIVSFELGFASDDVVAIWPAAGLCSWVALRYGWKCLPVIFLSHEGYSLAFQDGPAMMYLAANIINPLAYYSATLLYRRLGGDTNVLHSVRHTLLFITVNAVATSAIAASLGTLAIMSFLGIPMENYWRIAWRWFFSDYTGILLLAPPLIALHRSTPLNGSSGIRLAAREIPQPMLVSAAVIFVLYLTSFSMPDGLGQYPIVLLTMPLCIWLALNRRARSSTVMLTVTVPSSLTMVLAAVGDASEASFLAVQLYGVVVMCTSLVLQATSIERARLLVALGIEREQLEQKVAARTADLRTLAETDALTGLANRRSFECELEAAFNDARDNSMTHYLFYMDLDRFKVVNDTSGHAAGDALLKRVTALLQSNVRDGDLIGRLGGDEFAVLLRSCPESVARDIAESIRAEAEALRFTWEGDSHHIGTSIGVTLVDPACANLASLQVLADAACYAAKNSGRNRVHVANTADNDMAAHRNRVRWAHRLSAAMDDDHFVLYGQRIEPVRATHDEPEHVEVLLRLRDMETRQLVPPNEFMPAAERYGLSTRMDEWVVRELMRGLYLHSAFEASQRRYWVNLCGPSLADERFVNFLIKAMADSPIEPGLINFEIAETSVIHNIHDASRLMKKLHETGCQFALDDFGKGLSSFAHLKTLPVDYLKIDGTFVGNVSTDETDRVFVKSIIDIAHTMSIRTVAESVEDDETLARLRDMGIDYVQGFGVHEPTPLAPRLKRPSLANAKQKAS